MAICRLSASQKILKEGRVFASQASQGTKSRSCPGVGAQDVAGSCTRTALFPVLGSERGSHNLLLAIVGRHRAEDTMCCPTTQSRLREEFQCTSLRCSGMPVLVCLTYGFRINDSGFGRDAPVAEAAGSRADPLRDHMA